MAFILALGGMSSMKRPLLICGPAFGCQWVRTLECQRSGRSAVTVESKELARVEGCANCSLAARLVVFVSSRTLNVPIAIILTGPRLCPRPRALDAVAAVIRLSFYGWLTAGQSSRAQTILTASARSGRPSLDAPSTFDGRSTVPKLQRS